MTQNYPNLQIKNKVDNFYKSSKISNVVSFRINIFKIFNNRSLKKDL